MIVGRVLFAPLLLWLALRVHNGWLVSACILTEVLLDVFDGMVARQLGVATPLLRRMDSLIDTIFFLGVLYVACVQHFEAVWQQRWWLGGLIAMEIARYAFDYLKFHREAAYHMWSSKAWGLLLGIAVIALLGFNRSGWLLSAALIVGIACDVEGLAISSLLLESVEDVPHLGRALKIRREQMARRNAREAAATAR